MLKYIFTIILSLNLWGQSFQISFGDDPNYDFSSNEIFFLQIYRDSTGNPFWQVKRTDLLGTYIQNVEIPSVPVFANKSGIGIFKFHANDYDPKYSHWKGGYYLYDSQINDTIQQIISQEVLESYSYWYSSGLLFSPTDSKFLLFPQYSFAYYSLEDSAIYDPGHDFRISIETNWISDSTLMVLNENKNIIFEYNYVTDNFDTLVKLEDTYGEIGDFSYNGDKNILLYSIINYSIDEWQRLILMDLNSGKKENIFHDFNGEYPDYSGHSLMSILWSPDNKKAIINSHTVIDFGESIFLLFDADNDSLMLFNNPESGVRSAIQWINNDTLVFYTQSYIYGYSVNKALHISENHSIPLNNMILYQNYPNPFNISTNITFQISSYSLVEIYIFDVTGKLVDKILSRKYNAGVYTENWRAENLASGIYYIQLKALNNIITKKCILIK